MEPSPKSLLRDYGITVGLAIFFALLVRFFLIEAFRIPSASMHPTLESGDTIFVSKFPFGLRMPGQIEPFVGGRAPKLGEVVVYSQEGETPRDSIKRVVAVEDDSFELRGGRLWVNGRELSAAVPKDQPCGEERGKDGTRWRVCWESPLIADAPPRVVPKGHVLLMGDSRTLAGEARGIPAWAIVPSERIRGKALMIWLSVHPPLPGNPDTLFSRIRTERMFQRI